MPWPSEQGHVVVEAAELLLVLERDGLSRFTNSALHPALK
jgi:hypothetical protein